MAGADDGWFRWNRLLYWGALVIAIAAVVVSTGYGDYVTAVTVPAYIYVFGFLGALVYVFTSLAKEFGDEVYVYKVLSKAAAALPLAAGVYLLAFAFPGASEVGGNGTVSVQRFAAGLAFIAGVFVSMTLKALGSLAERLLGVQGDGG